ncbi:MAG: guanylate kinase [Halioglobus sp.]|nr:guanylate kinase [Halioglobus sp.]
MAFPGSLFIISAASGAGKTSLLNALVSSVPNIEVSVSHTTRARRAGEQDGVHYHFVAPAEFEEMLENGVFLEQANVFGNMYGTSQQWVEDKLASGADILLEIDWQGAQQVRKLLPDSVGIFILPPSREALRQRLVGRGQDDPDIIAARMEKATNEMSHYCEFNYVVINDDFHEALQDLTAIIRAQRLQQAPRRPEVQKLITELLS